MEIRVVVVPNSRTAAVTKISDSSYRVKVNARAVEGRANARLLEILAEYFYIPKSHVRIVKGLSNRNKVVEIQKA